MSSTLQRMIRDLTDLEIEQLLQKECYGHLGCCTEVQRPYVVPVTFAYEKHAIHCFSFEGKKVDMMRKQPHVCFQIEQHTTAESWKSVMIWGAFEELSGEARADALSLLLERLWSEANRDHPLYLPFRNSAKTLEAARKEENVVLYRINILEQSGRMETYEK